MPQFRAKIKSRIENILSQILSDKYKAKVTIKFRKDNDDNENKTQDFKKE